MKLKKKKRHHYVWRKYLSAWVDDERLYCLMGDKIFQSGLMGIAQERYFYKLKELTEEELEFLKRLIERDNRPLICKLNQGWIGFFNKIYEIKRIIDERGISHPDIDGMLDVLIHNYEEDFHSKIESDSIKFLEKMYNKDLSFYYDEDELIEFLFFICQQYFRTQNISNNACKTLCSYKDFNIDAMWTILRHTSATALGFSLYEDRAKYQLVLLENVSTIPFVTGDQPIINTHAIGLRLDEAPKELEFYYPLTPLLALLLTDNADLKGEITISADEKDVIKYNKYIYSMSGKQVYASQRAPLELLLNE